MRLSLRVGFFVVLIGCARTSPPQPDLGVIGDLEGSSCSGEEHAFADALSEPALFFRLGLYSVLCSLRAVRQRKLRWNFLCADFASERA